MKNHSNHAQKTELITQSCDHSGCWLGFLGKNPEFFEWKWVDVDKITDNVVDFKKEVYEKLKEEINKVLSN